MKLAFALLFCSLAAFGQNGKEIAVGYADCFEKLPLLSFEKTTQAFYEKCSPAKQAGHSKLTETTAQLLIPTKKGIIRLERYREGRAESTKGYQYAGYYPGLKMHAVIAHHVAEHIGFSDLVLIDSLTARRYAVVSVGDDAVQLPIPSPDNRYLVYYYNWVYDRNSSFIGVLKIGAGNHAFARLAEKASFSTKEWGVEEIRWIDGNSFVVKAYSVRITDNPGTKDYSYYLTRLGADDEKVSKD